MVETVVSPPGGGNGGQAHTQSVTSTIGDLRLKLTAPALNPCIASAGKHQATLTATAVHTAAHAKFVRATLFIDKGVKHTKHGKTTYAPNATAHKLPASFALSDLKPGRHALTVVLYVKERQGEHGHIKTVTIRRTLKAKLTVC
jgi:uncharacterized protein (DUF2141 family)